MDRARRSLQHAVWFAHFNGLLVCSKGQQQCRLQGIYDSRLAADVWQEMVKSRLLFRARSTAPAANAHEGAVVGLAVDAANRLLVSGGYDGRLRVWAFKVCHTSLIFACSGPVENHTKPAACQRPV